MEDVKGGNLMDELGLGVNMMGSPAGPPSGWDEEESLDGIVSDISKTPIDAKKGQKAPKADANGMPIIQDDMPIIEPEDLKKAVGDDNKSENDKDAKSDDGDDSSDEISKKDKKNEKQSKESKKEPIEELQILVDKLLLDKETLDKIALSIHNPILDLKMS